MRAMPASKRRATAATPKTPRKKRKRVPATPGGKLRAILDQRGESYTAFAERIGRRYHNVVRWMSDREFTPENKGLCVTALGLRRGYFGEDVIARYEASPGANEARAVLDDWLRTSPNARGLTMPDIALLRSIRFEHASLRPSFEFLDGVAYAIRGAIRVDELLAFEEDNRALSDSLAQKPPLKKR